MSATTLEPQYSRTANPIELKFGILVHLGLLNNLAPFAPKSDMDLENAPKKTSPNLRFWHFFDHNKGKRKFFEKQKKVYREDLALHVSAKFQLMRCRQSRATGGVIHIYKYI